MPLMIKLNRNIMKVYLCLDKGHFITVFIMGRVCGLTVKADACVGCGHCNKRYSFHVDQVARMQEILDYFNS